MRGLVKKRGSWSLRSVVFPHELGDLKVSFLGSDHPKERWVQEVKRALGEWSQQPHLLQKFVHPLSVNHPVWSEERGEMIDGNVEIEALPLLFGDG